MPQGSPQTKVRTLIDTIYRARASLKAIGAKNQLFSNEGTIGLLVGKLMEGTQASWYLYLTRAPYNREEDMLNKWLIIKRTAVERWQFQKTAMLWYSAGMRVSTTGPSPRIRITSKEVSGQLKVIGGGTEPGHASAKDMSF